MHTYSQFPPDLTGRLWQCTVVSCCRVEWTLLPDPRCAGTPERRHAEADTEPVSDDEGLAPSDNRRLFL